MTVKLYMMKLNTTCLLNSFSNLRSAYHLPLIILIMMSEETPEKAPNFQIDIKHEMMKFINDKVGLKEWVLNFSLFFFYLQFYILNFIQMTQSKHFCGGNWHREQKKCFTYSGKGTVQFWSITLQILRILMNNIDNNCSL